MYDDDHDEDDHHEETFQQFAVRRMTKERSQIIRMDTRDLSLDMLYAMRNDIMQDCPCCEGVGHHMQHATVELIPGFPVTGVRVFSCGTCEGRGVLPYISAN